MKQVLDRVGAATGLVVLSPVLAVAACAIRIKLGSPVVFRQQRPGRGGRPFYLVKFRTMTNERGPDGELLPDAQRMTAFGRFLRSSSVDELPQLWNVLRGDMSLVGPRPLMMRYLPRYSEEQAKRHDVLPGITGWAQINGRNALTWDEKFKFDLWYVKNWSPLLDLKILAMTVASVVRREGISNDASVTMPEFWGDQGPPAH